MLQKEFDLYENDILNIADNLSYLLNIKKHICWVPTKPVI